MIAYHLAYDLCLFGFLPWRVIESAAMQALERLIAWSFILCAGASCCFSRSNLRRGCICAAAGAVVTAASFLVDTPIRFGILQFLSAMMLLYALLAALGQRVKLAHPAVVPVCAALYLLTAWLTQEVTVQSRWLFWLGFRCEDFLSYDYFPLLPYAFLFVLGVWLGQYAGRCPERFRLRRRLSPALGWTGRHTLAVYLAHQPVLYGLCALAARR